MNLNVLAINNASIIVEKKYGKYYGCKPHHNIDAYLKSTFEHVHNIFANELVNIRRYHMRSPYDIQRCLYSYVDLAEQHGHLKYVNQAHSFRLHINNRLMYQEFEKYKPVFFCMNDTEHATDEDRYFSIEYLENMFYVKSKFEL